MGPDTWVKLLYQYGPFALLVFFLYVAERKARSALREAQPADRPLAKLVYALTWMAVFGLVLAAVSAWWKSTFPEEFVISGRFGNLMGSETIFAESPYSDSLLFLSKVFSSNSYSARFEYQWRLISRERLPDGLPIEFAVGTPEAQDVPKWYDVRVHSAFYQRPVELLYDRAEQEVILKYWDNGERVEHLRPSPDRKAELRQRTAWPLLSFSAYAQSEDLFNQLAIGLDSSDPILRLRAQDELVKLGGSAAPFINRTMTDPNSSFHRRLGVLSALNRMRVDPTILSSGALKAIKAENTDPNPTLREEASKFIALNPSAFVMANPSPAIIHSHYLSEIMPSALAYLPSGMLLLNTAKPFLLQIRPDGIYSAGDLGQYASLVGWDLAAARLRSGADSVFVILNRRPSGTGKLVQYINGIELPKAWSAPSPSGFPQFSGVAIDPQKEIAYVGRSGHGVSELYELSLAAGVSGELKRVMVWSDQVGPRNLGPMVVDGRHGLLFAADPQRGSLYRINLANTTDRKQLNVTGSPAHGGLGKPVGLALDWSSETLYVAALVRLWVVHLDSDSGLIDRSWQPRAFQNLTAIAVDGDGNVWAGDQGKHAVYVFSARGELLKTFKE